MRRVTLYALTAATVLAACATACGGGGDRKAGADSTSATAATGDSTTTPAAGGNAPGGGTAAAMPATGTTVDVKMVGDDKGYRFEPAAITVKAGDAVRWTNVSGGPHNVTFWADSVPAGAQAQLGANMPNTTAPDTGPLLTDPNATYAVSTAGLKPGVYHYYCTPHLALGMKATVTVQ